jgi:hypothetical protein
LTLSGGRPRDVLWLLNLVDIGQQPSVQPTGFVIVGSNAVSTGLVHNVVSRQLTAASITPTAWTTASTSYYSKTWAFIGPPSIIGPVIPVRNPIGPRGFLGVSIRKFKERSDTPYTAAVIPRPPFLTIVPSDHIGPKGFLGIPPRRFRERTQGVSVGATLTYLPITILPGNHIGPKGLLGIPIRRFKERSESPYVATVTPLPVPPALPVIVPPDHLGPRGLLGIPVRRFKERSGEVAVGYNIPVSGTFIPAFLWVMV